MPPRTSDQPILVPVDFSPHSEAALVYAADLAEMLGCPLVVLHVVHDPGEAPGYYVVKGREKQLKKLEDVASDMLDAFMREMIANHPEHTVLERANKSLVVGLPVNRILETAEKTRACMIIMGSQGRTGLSHMLLGSKAEQIVRLSPIPVMIIKNKIHK